MKNNLKKKIYKFLLDEAKDAVSEAEAKDVAKEADESPEDKPVRPGSVESDKPVRSGSVESDKPVRSGRTEKPYSYNRVDGDSVPYHSNADLVKKIQQALTDISGEYSKMLQQGDPRYGGTQTIWGKPVDGNYGPRTDIALTAFYNVEKNISRASQSPITSKDLIEIKTVTSETSKITPATAEKAAANAAAAKSEKAESPKTESVSYKKDLLKPTKNRHKEVEKLVFERLVKNANRL